MVTAMLPQDIGTGFNWREFAACAGIDYRNDVFFIEGAGAVYQEARSYCSNCFVVVDCLIEGMENDLGMWGCMSPNERISVGKHMQVGYGLKTLAEVRWKYHRDKGKLSVPSKSVWDDWDA